ncbi:uncharacterized protein LOC113470193 [Diaphorina citri]|uniref:Uncharacterized protein LOC113470193 n=1 Tax=Diaphorina citri TaxID=121845 RepID=A0A3Q0JBB7_DIACI|nr:uncharacterized protein LOC113470193 [Diaphorina citri]
MIIKLPVSARIEPAPPCQPGKRSTTPPRYLYRLITKGGLLKSTSSSSGNSATRLRTRSTSAFKVASPPDKVSACSRSKRPSLGVLRRHRAVPRRTWACMRAARLDSQGGVRSLIAWVERKSYYDEFSLKIVH